MHMCACARVPVRVSLHVCMCVCVCTCECACVHLCVHVRVGVCKHTRVHVQHLGFALSSCQVRSTTFRHFAPTSLRSDPFLDFVRANAD